MPKGNPEVRLALRNHLLSLLEFHSTPPSSQFGWRKSFQESEISASVQSPPTSALSVTFIVAEILRDWTVLASSLCRSCVTAVLSEIPARITLLHSLANFPSILYLSALLFVWRKFQPADSAASSVLRFEGMRMRPTQGPVPNRQVR